MYYGTYYLTFLQSLSQGFSLVPLPLSEGKALGMRLMFLHAYL